MNGPPIPVEAVALDHPTPEPCPTCGATRLVAHVATAVGGRPQSVARVVRCPVCHTGDGLNIEA